MLIRRLFELITPVSCLVCAQEGARLCASCASAVTLPAGACFACGRLTANGKTCEMCGRRAKLGGTVTAAHYEGPVRDLVLELKFHHSWAAIDPAVGLMLRAIDSGLADKLDGITAVPVAPSRRRERGYNQSELLAKALARRLHLKYKPMLRRQNAVHQLGAGRKERLEQVEHVFEPIRAAKGRWLIVDDVMTTGATLEACAAALKGAGAQSVMGIVVAAQRG